MILVDSHVHIYACFDLGDLLETAFANFKSEASRFSRSQAFDGVLLLTEAAGDNWFEYLSNHTREGKTSARDHSAGWTFHPTMEIQSLLARGAGRKSLFLVAGRQIVTAEDLEVLALFTDKVFEDGHPLEQALEAVTQSGGLPVIPWGFGKWTGSRGRLLLEKLEDAKNHHLFIGDNGGRASFLPRPRYFEVAEAKGIRILPGSDPLPFASEYRRTGSFGFRVDGSINSMRPAEDIRRILLDPNTRPRPYGALEKPWRFFRNQLAMQIKKRLHRSEVKMS